MKGFVVFVIGIMAVLVISGCVSDIACTEDARECPDGTMVVRVPPDCEFEPCPGCSPGETRFALCPDGAKYLKYSCDENGVWHEVAYIRNPCEIPDNASETDNGAPEDEYTAGKEMLKKYLNENGMDCSWSSRSTFESFAIDPSDNNVMYIAVRSEGVFKSIDRGETWRKIDSGILAYKNMNVPGEYCFESGKLVIDPTNTNRVLLAPLDINSGTITDPYTETAGVWETLDGGETWRQLANGEMNVGGAGALAIDPNNPDTIYFGIFSGRASYGEADPNKEFNTVGVLYKTLNGGETWVELPTGLIEGLQGMKVFVDPDNSQRIMHLTQAHTHIYYDNGSYVEVPLDEQLGPLISEDGGNTWTSLADKLPFQYQAIWEGDVAEQNFDHVIVRPDRFGPGVTHETKKMTLYSLDGGVSFSESDTYIHVPRYDPHDPDGNHLIGYYHIYPNLMESRDAGATWTILAPPPQEIKDNDIYMTNIVWDPVDSDTIYMNGEWGHLWRSEDGGLSWTKILDHEQLPN